MAAKEAMCELAYPSAAQWPKRIYYRATLC